MGDDGLSHCWETERPRLIRAMFLVSGDLDAAAEIVDEAFVRVFARSRRGGIDDLRRYLWRAAFNEARRQGPRRRRMHPTRDGSIEGLLHESRIGAGADRDAVETRDALWRAAGDIDERGRTIVVLRYVVDLSYPQIADVLGVPVGTVKSTLHRALVSLRAALQPSGEEPT